MERTLTMHWFINYKTTSEKTRARPIYRSADTGLSQTNQDTCVVQYAPKDAWGI